MILAQTGPTPSTWSQPAFVHAVFARQLDPNTPVSLDGGRSWLPAWQAAQRLQAPVDDGGLAAIVPIRVEGWSMGAGYVAIFSGLFFAGPLAIGACVAGVSGDGKALPIVLFALFALAAGPLPIAAMAWLGLRNLRRDPSYRGKGRAIFALVVAALLTVPCLVGLAGAVVHVL